MTFHSTLEGFSPSRLRQVLAGLPRAKGYRVDLKPLRYRTAPHLQAECDWGKRVITLQVPEPFHPFEEPVFYKAKRVRTRAARGKLVFRWFHRDVQFRSRAEVIRFLYCHEFAHYWLHDVLGRAGQAETACDRYALQSFRRRGRVDPPGAPGAVTSPGLRVEASRARAGRTGS
jgi:hypothetical protein